MKMDLKKRELEGVDWIRVAQDRNKPRAVVNTVMNVQVLGTVSSSTGPASRAGSSSDHRLPACHLCGQNDIPQQNLFQLPSFLFIILQINLVLFLHSLSGFGFPTPGATATS